MSTLVYVSNADSGSLTVLALDTATGSLTTLQTLELGGTLMPMAQSPDRRRLYAARRNAPEAVLSLAIDAGTGLLTALGEHLLPASMAYVSTDRSGRFLFSASYGGNLVAVSPIDGDGIALGATQVLPTAPKSHAIRVDASNRFVWSTVLGGDAVLQWRLDAGSGTLTPNEPPALPIRTGAGPRHLALHPAGRFAYLLNELDASVDVLAIDAERGTLRLLQSLSTLTSGFTGDPWAADIQLTPDGRFLYVSERRHSTLAALRVDPVSGLLSLLGHVPAQAQPRSFAIEPGGRFLIVAGQQSNKLGVHAIHAESGALALTHEHDVGRNPSWVETLLID